MREKAEKPAKRKLTRAERKQIEAVIRQAKGDGKAHTVQDSIPFQNMFPDGLCRLEGGAFSKTIAFEDVNYRLAGPEDQRSIFESLCDFYNGYDPSIGVQVSLDSRSGGSAADEMFGIRRQGNDLDPIRDEAVDILRMQYKRGNNGYVKTKYVTLTIEAENLPAARARFARIETDTLNRFKVMGAAAHVLDGKERLELLYNILHPEGGQFAFEWDWLPASGLSVKDFISPSSFHFGETRTFRIGKRYGAVSFLQILAPEMHDRILTDFMEADGNIMVTMHIRGEYLYVGVENAYFAPVDFDPEERLYRATKPGTLHGMGLKSARATARKYHSELVLKADGDAFSASTALLLSHKRA